MPILLVKKSKGKRGKDVPTKQTIFFYVYKY